MARRQHHVSSQQSSSMPLSSKTSDAGWEYVQSQGSQKGVSFPVGSEVRFPELSSPTLRSPISRSKVTSDAQNSAPPIVQDASMADSNGPSLPSSTEAAQDSSQFRTFLASGGYSAGNADAQHSERANAFRGAQLQDLFKTQGMWRPSMPSSPISPSQPNIFKESDDNGTERLITHLIEEDVKDADEERARDHERWKRLESEQQARTDELRSELQHARENENRLRGDREYWKHEAEYYKQEHQEGDDYDEGEEEEVSPSGRQPTSAQVDPVVDQVDLVVVVMTPRSRHHIAVDQREVILRDRPLTHQQAVAQPMSLKSRYPEGKPIGLSCLHFRKLLILTVGCHTVLPTFSALAQIQITRNGSLGSVQHSDRIQTLRA